MNRKFLEGLGIEKDLIDQILDEHHSDLNIEKAKTQRQADQVSDQKEVISDLQKKVTDLEAMKPADLQADRDRIQSEFDSYKAEVEAREEKRTYEQRRAEFFKDVQFHDDFAKRGILSAFDDQNFTYGDNGFENAADWLKQIQADSPGAFGEKDKGPRFSGRVDQSDGSGMSVTNEQVQKMTFTERLKFKNENPDAYAKMFNKNS